jgi:hypothetical protein
MGLGAAITAMGNKRRETKEARAAALREQKEQSRQTPPPSAPPPAFTPQVQVTPATPVYMAPPAPFAGPEPMSSSGFAGTPPTMASSMPGASTTFVPPYSGWTPPVGTAPEVATTLPPLPTDDTLGRATFWPRLGAFTIDSIVVGMTAGFIGLAGPQFWVIAMLAYHIGFWGWRSTTPAGILFNLRVVRVDRTPIFGPLPRSLRWHRYRPSERIA